MKTISSSLYHRVLPPEPSGTALHPAIIVLHGRGADEEDLLGLAPLLPRQAFVVSARAPFPYEGGGYTWYDVQEFGKPDGSRFRESCDRLETFLADVRNGYPVDPGAIVLFGFSMGAVMSLSTALVSPETVRGVSANSGYVPEGTHLAFRWQDLADTAFFITHGTLDPVIPVALAHRARLMFERSNAPFQYREYPAGHELTDDALRETVEWMEGLMQGT